MQTIREPAVAGQFYPAERRQLGMLLTTMLEAADAPAGPAPKALIVPHAGYRYSGPVAASAYARLLPYRDRYSRVVLLGTCHVVAVRGLALSGADTFRTPLGDVPVDGDFVAALDIPVLDEAHAAEHSLEVHLPFLQATLADFSLVPIVVGQIDPDDVAAVLDNLWNGPQTMIVVSSDLSHYLAYEAARTRDRATCDWIEKLDPYRIGPGDACGSFAVNGLLAEARRKGLTIETLDLRNSGDTAGGSDRVVGYGAWMLTEPGTRVN
jgi:AmmeMemoRadiSam system protein B